MLCEGCAKNAMQAQAPAAGPPQGLTANLAKLAGRPQGPAAPGLPQGPGSGVGGQPQVPGDWGRKLEKDGAGAASNAEEFTKQFMQQLAGGQ